MRKSLRDIIGAAAFVAIFAAFLGMAFQFPNDVRTYPMVVCIAGVLFSAVLLGRSLTVHSRTKNQPDTEEHMEKAQIVKIFVTVVAAVVYVVLTGVIGYFVTTFIFVAAFSYYLDNKQKIWSYLLFALILDGLLYLAFDLFLKVRLPQGFLF